MIITRQLSLLNPFLSIFSLFNLPTSGIFTSFDDSEYATSCYVSGTADHGFGAASGVAAASGGLASSGAWAGAAGFGFAKVLVGPRGERMVPHFRAVDVASDNRLPFGSSWTSEHRFAVDCAAPTVRASVGRRGGGPFAVVRALRDPRR